VDRRSKRTLTGWAIVGVGLLVALSARAVVYFNEAWLDSLGPWLLSAVGCSIQVVGIIVVFLQWRKNSKPKEQKR